MGLHRAGFDVTGVDMEPHPDYPFPMVVSDALSFIDDGWMEAGGFVVVAAGPPCPRYSVATPAHARERHPDLVVPVRERLIASGLPYIIENVPGAPLIDPVTYCGSSFGLRVRRHRLFESNVPLVAPPCNHREQGQAVGVYGAHADRPGGWKRPDGTSRGLKATSVADAQDAMGIDWMTKWHDLADAIPPAYTEHIGKQLLEVVARGEAQSA